MRHVTATQLAKMGKCEKQVYLDYHYGEDESLTEAFIKRGNTEHLRFYQKLSGTTDRRCFIATAVFGSEAWETQALRRFRDQRLLTHCLGRLLVTLYYRISPKLIPYIQRYPILKDFLHNILTKFITKWGKACSY